jgi:hypothetical protein
MRVVRPWSVVCGYIMGNGQPAGRVPGRAASGYLRDFKVDGRTAYCEIKDASL